MIDGFVVIDKPAGMTSHDVVARIRRGLQQRRVGHSGTLDPSATGVLLIGVGRATRLFRFTDTLTKTYEGTLVLGATTTTLDDEGDVVETFDTTDVTLERVRAVLTQFRGEISQVPPMVSAVKTGGKRLHELHREGKTVERAPRNVRVDALEIAPTTTAHEFTITVSCSTGTYIRTLCADIGSALHNGAHLRGLRRKAIGPIDVESAIALADWERDPLASLQPPLAMLTHLPRRVIVDEALRESIRVGRPIPRESADPTDGYVAMVTPLGELLAVYAASDTTHRPEVVLAS